MEKNKLKIVSVLQQLALGGSPWWVFGKTITRMKARVARTKSNAVKRGSSEEGNAIAKNAGLMNNAFTNTLWTQYNVLLKVWNEGERQCHMGRKITSVTLSNLFIYVDKLTSTRNILYYFIIVYRPGVKSESQQERRVTEKCGFGGKSRKRVGHQVKRIN